MTGFGQTFLGKEWADIETFFSAEGKAAIAALKPSLEALEAYAKTNGVPALEALASAVFAGAASSVEAGAVTPQAIGVAAVAAAAPLLKGDLTDLTGEVHALATAAVTNVATALKTTA